jgi:type IV pilus assembly protein PilX
MHIRHSRKQQRGAALVVGLLLLSVLTLLAIAGMNTASTELIMAGNEQFREGAFQAAEAGVEQQLPNLDQIPPGSTKSYDKAVDLGNSTSYTTNSRFRGEGSVPGSSTKFVGFYYDITSTGQGQRNATSVQTQGAYVINQNPDGG